MNVSLKKIPSFNLSIYSSELLLDFYYEHDHTFALNTNEIISIITSSSININDNQFMSYINYGLSTFVDLCFKWISQPLKGDNDTKTCENRMKENGETFEGTGKAVLRERKTE